MTSTVGLTRPESSLAYDLVTLVTSPRRGFPILLEREGTSEVTFFAAVSGVYVAYVAAERLHLGDHFPFALVAVNLVLIGAALGVFALYVTGGLLSWSAQRLRGSTDVEHMWSVFGYATWPFVPLLVILIPLELSAYGTAVFSASRPPAAPVVPIIATVLELSTILCWLYLMVRGTEIGASLSRTRAAEAIVLSFVETIVIAILAIVILAVSFMI